MRPARWLAVACCVIAAGGGIADAQTNVARAIVSLNVGLQPSSTTSTGSTTKPVYLETATIDTSYGVSKGRFFDGGILVRVINGFAVGVAVSSFNRKDDATVTGSIPHPFFFKTPRTLAGSVSGVERSEVVAHVQAAYVLASRRMTLALSGGPSFFRVRQDLVSDISYSDPYPYDTVTFTSAAIAKATASKVGFNAGADIGIRLSRAVGVGGLVRFSRATLSFPLAGSDTGVSADVGGTQVAGGLRLFF